MDTLGPTSDKMDTYEPIKVLGEGSFGKVYLMRHRHERKLVCVKVIKIKNIPKKERDACKMEVDLLKRLRHPNIVGYRDSFLNPSRETLCIVMQVMCTVVTTLQVDEVFNVVTPTVLRRRRFVRPD